MRRSSWVGLMIAAVLLAGIAPVWGQPPGPAEAPGRPQEPPATKTVTLDLKNVPLDEAINRVVAATNLSVVIAGPLPKEPRITMRLVDAEPVGALELLATAGGLAFDTSPQGRAYRSTPTGPALAPMVVLIAARPGMGGGQPTPGGPRPWETGVRGTPAPEASGPPLTGAPIATNIAVDLNVKEAPFREAIDQITKQIPSTDRVRIVVDESVPKDLRVTARLSKMPLNWVIDSLVQQAGLTYGVQDQPDPVIAADLEGRVQQGLMSSLEMQGRLTNAPRLHTVYIVPKPELKVTGSAGG